MPPLFTGKRVLITGICGTVGYELASLLLTEHGIAEVIGIDHNENELAFRQQQLAAFGPVRVFLGDVRDAGMLVRRTRGIDVVFHTAACKHVDMCEISPMEAVQTNILGTQSVIEACLANGVQQVVFTSTDKAVNPTNVMGTSKLMGERLMTAAAIQAGANSCFVSTRFGNVMGSRGSVIPIFRRQIRAGGPVTVTDPAMTRFIMSLRTAVRLVIESVGVGRSGDVVVTKMPAVRVIDLAEVMISECAPLCGRRPQDIPIEIIGTKPGEKTFEELVNDEEVRRALELSKYLVVRPALMPSKDWKVDYPDVITFDVVKPYTSEAEPKLTKDQLAEILSQHGLLHD